MTREIKFKFYDKEEKRLVAIADVFDNALYPYLARNTLIPCQFTGLKDKNGKEIYEGDILRRYVEETETTTGEQRMTVDDMCSCYATIRDTILDKNPLEIIGNIYENPELLK